MSTKARILLVGLVGFVLVAVFWFGQVEIQNFFLGELREKSYSQIASMRSDILAKKFQAAKPLREREMQDLIIQAPAAISVRIAKNGSQRILFAKNPEQTLPIASLTKLMTGLVVMENCNLNQQIVFSETAASMEGEPNFFKAGETFYSKDLLYSCLIESSNRAGQALAESLGKDMFVGLMNAKAKELGLNNTHFINPTGLDPDYPEILSNFSSAWDLVRFSTHLFKNDFFTEIAGTKEFDIYEIGKGFHHKAIRLTSFYGRCRKFCLEKQDKLLLPESACLLFLTRQIMMVISLMLFWARRTILEK